jgi:uncharacterized membrane protein
MTMDLAVLTFDHPEGAEQAFSKLQVVPADAPWMDEVAFVERRRRGRIVIRGTFAGHYLDIDDVSDPMGRDTVIGTLTGAVVGAAFGWFGFAAGLVAGGAIGSFVQAEHIPKLEGELFDELRADVGDGHSAVMLLAGPEHVDAMVSAFEGLGGRLTRRSLSEEALEALTAVAAAAPPAAHAASAE